MAFPLSILDLSPIDSGSTGAQALQNTIALARRADELGYTRYWLAEHHNSTGIASSAPEILIESIARETTRIRVGSGGIMLPNHPPLKVVETFRVLEALHPGRIDLGIGRAPGTDQVTALALRRSMDALGADDFPEQLAEMFAFSNGEFPASHPFRSISAAPGDVALPPVWLLGSSGFSAQLAAQLGLAFAFAFHINPNNAMQALQSYRENFKPSAQLQQPRSLITASIVCAETDERAEELAASVDLALIRIITGRSAPLATPEEARAYPYTAAERFQIRSSRARLIIGSPATVRARVSQLVERSGADEAMLTTFVYGHENRVRALELLADAFELQRLAHAPLALHNTQMRSEPG
ncbi:MAG: LLM class flavin-dependent oxidoreductase [Ktedonobacteraceae bacterium]